MKKFVLILFIALALLIFTACYYEDGLQYSPASEPEVQNDVAINEATGETNGEDMIEGAEEFMYGFEEFLERPHIGPVAVDESEVPPEMRKTHTEDGEEIRWWILVDHAAPQNTVEELALRSTDVVRAQILDKSGQWFRSSWGDYTIYTVYQIRIVETFSGEVRAGEILEMRVLGGQVGDIVLTVEQYPEFAIGEDLALFLDVFDGTIPALLSSVSQSAYRFPVTRAGDIMAMSEDTRLVCVSPGSNPITLTIGDLQRIAEENNLR